MQLAKHSHGSQVRARDMCVYIQLSAHGIDVKLRNNFYCGIDKKLDSDWEKDGHGCRCLIWFSSIPYSVQHFPPESEKTKANKTEENQ